MFEEAYPESHFEEGIAEANMPPMAAGLTQIRKIHFSRSFVCFVGGRAFDRIRQTIAIGYMVGLALKAAEDLTDRVFVKVVTISTIKPIEFVGIQDTFGYSEHNYIELLECMGLLQPAVEEAVLKMAVL